MNDWLLQILNNPDLRRMGHGQRLDDLNLGLGWLYYAVARILRPRNVVVIGSYRGFVPLVFSRAMNDNLEKGTIHFIDPSRVDDFWKDPTQVQAYFASFGSQNVCHHRMTTQEFHTSDAFRALECVDILFVDGYHSEDQARFDYEVFRDRLTPDGIAFFHDSTEIKTSGIYGKDRVYSIRVKCFIDTLKMDPGLQVFDLPFSQGVTMVRRVQR